MNPPHIRRNAQKKLTKAQKKLSRRAVRAKKEGRRLRESKNYQKQRIKTAKLNLQAKRQREAFFNVESKKIVESQDAIFVEDLNTKELLKNNPLAGAISDASWGKFHAMLEYKSRFYGKTFLRVPAKNTTQECCVCGHIMRGSDKIGLETREWTCPECGTHHNRDGNSAKVVKKRGLALLAAAQTA